MDTGMLALRPLPMAAIHVEYQYHLPVTSTTATRACGMQPLTGTDAGAGAYKYLQVSIKTCKLLVIDA